MEHKHCTRGGTATGAEVKLEYDLYYTGDKLNDKTLDSNESKEDTLEVLLNLICVAMNNYSSHFSEFSFIYFSILVSPD